MYKKWKRNRKKTKYVNLCRKNWNQSQLICVHHSKPTVLISQILLTDYWAAVCSKTQDQLCLLLQPFSFFSQWACKNRTKKVVFCKCKVLWIFFCMKIAFLKFGNRKARMKLQKRTITKKILILLFCACHIFSKWSNLNFLLPEKNPFTSFMCYVSSLGISEKHSTKQFLSKCSVESQYPFKDLMFGISHFCFCNWLLLVGWQVITCSPKNNK